jgi:hypothetical protein
MSSLTTAEGDKRGLVVISRDMMSWEPVAGDKRSALDAPDTDTTTAVQSKARELGHRVPNVSRLGRGTRN